MTTKNIEFKVSLNQAEANKQIQELQQKLQGIQKTGAYADRAKAVFGEGSGMSKEATRLFQAQQSEDLKFLREKFNNLQRLKQTQDKTFQDNQKALQSERTMEADKLRILKEQSQIRETLTRAQREQVDIAERAKALDPTLKGFKGAAARPFANVRDGGHGKEADFEFSEKGKLDFEGVVGGSASQADNLTKQIIRSIGVQRIAAMVAAGIQGAANFGASTFFEYGQDIARQQAGTIGNMAKASGVDALTSGRGIEMSYYSPERQAALRNAQTALSGMSLRGAGDLLGSTVAGAGTGAAIGAGLASIGGPLTAAGGAAVGGVLGGIGGFGKSLFSGQTGAGISSFVRGEGYDAGVQQHRAAYLAQNFESNMQAEMEKNFFKQKSLNYLEGNRGSFIQAQQMAGIGDDQLFDRLGAAGGMFTTQDKLGAMSGIASAGGSTAQMRYGEQALNLKRGYGIQNAAGILGGLSGNLGGGQTGADEVTKKILADAFSVGLDASNFSRETEKFVSMSAKFVEASGARDVQGMSNVADSLGTFTAGTSMQEIGAAGFGKEYLNSRLGAGGSQYQKALQLSKSRRDLPGLNESQRTSLANMTPDQLQAGGMEVEAMAKSAGFESIEEFQKKAMGVKQFAITPTAGIEERQQSVKTLGQSLGVNPYNIDEINKKLSETKDPVVKAQLEQLKQEAGMAMSEMTAYDSTFAGKTESQKRATLSGITAFGDERGTLATAPQRATTGMEEGEKAQARSEQIMLQKAQESFGEYTAAATEASKATMAATEAFENFVNAVVTKSKDLEKYAQTLVDTPMGGRPVRPSR